MGQLKSWEERRVLVLPWLRSVVDLYSLPTPPAIPTRGQVCTLPFSKTKTYSEEGNLAVDCLELSWSLKQLIRIRCGITLPVQCAILGKYYSWLRRRLQFQRFDIITLFLTKNTLQKSSGTSIHEQL
jgi:hypothetical protein